VFLKKKKKKPWDCLPLSNPTLKERKENLENKTNQKFNVVEKKELPSCSILNYDVGCCKKDILPLASRTNVLCYGCFPFCCNFPPR